LAQTGGLSALLAIRDTGLFMYRSGPGDTCR